MPRPAAIHPYDMMVFLYISSLWHFGFFKKDLGILLGVDGSGEKQQVLVDFLYAQ